MGYVLVFILGAAVGYYGIPLALKAYREHKAKPDGSK